MNKEEFISIFMYEIRKSQTDNRRHVEAFSGGKEAGILHFLAHSEECQPSEIGNALLVSNARIANVLNNLEKKNLITREICSTDRRRIIVSITEEGKKLHDEFEKHLNTRLEKLFTLLGERDAEDFLRILKKINGADW